MPNSYTCQLCPGFSFSLPANASQTPSPFCSPPATYGSCCCFNARKNFGEHGEILRTPSKAELTNAVAKSYTSENSSASASSSASSSAGYDEQEVCVFVCLWWCGGKGGGGGCVGQTEGKASFVLPRETG